MSRSLRSFRAVLSSLLLLCFLTSHPASPESTEPWDGAAFTAEPAAIARAAAKVEGEAGDDVVVLLAEASYSYDEAGRETFVQRFVYLIRTPGAHESWSTVQEAWAPWHQARPEVRARVITPDGAEHHLDPATITENAIAEEAPDMFEDGRVLRAPLPATRPGAVVEQQVTLRDTAPFFDGGVVRFHGLDPGVPLRHARLTLEAPAGTPLRWVARRLPGVEPKESVDGGRRRLVFEVRDLTPADEPEAGLPPEVPRTSYVAFSTGRSWADLARRYSDIVDQTIRGSDVSAFIKSAGAPAASQIETINLFLARLGDEVRYTGVELGEGGLLPRKPSETLKRRFGDCKDKAVLLTAMLRASDIPAYVALLNAAEDEADVEESLPGFGLFNHVIVVVPGSPALWIDPTDPYARAGELPVVDQGRLALIASPTATALTRTPEATSADNREVETREFFLSGFGPSRVVETTELYGAPESSLRAYYAVEDAQAVRQALKSYAGTQYLAEDLTGLEYSKPTDLSTPMRLRIEVKNARRGFTDLHNAGAGVNPATLLARLPPEITEDFEEEEGEERPETARKRQDDYVFSRPMTIETRYRIVPPPGFVPQTLPASRVRRFGTVTLSEEYAAGEDRAITAVFRLDTGKRRISAQELETVRSGVREALQEETSLLLFDQTGEVHLANGRVREALAEFQTLAASAPKQALPHTRIARALLAGGLGEAAREEARRATRLEPKLAIAWRDLGWILQHDDLGRRFGKGFDRAGAIAAYRKARELDPKDAVARADLAILLEYDDQGQRYSPKADLAAAVDEYKALSKDLDNKAMDNNLLFALVRAGRFAEAKELATQGKDTGTAIALTAIAAADGTEAALREAERKIADKNARAAALQEASQNLAKLRRYSEAAALLDRASRQSGNAAALLSRADFLRRTRRHEEISLPADQPSSVCKRLVLLAATENKDPGRFAALFSRDLQPELRRLGDDAPRLFEQGFASASKQIRSREVPLDVAIDLALSVLQDTAAGNDETGYRISFSLPDGSTPLKAYVVREGAEYRIAAVSQSRSMLGAEALRRLERGDLAGARQWLDWAAEQEADEEGAGASGDPLPADPFTVLWKKGAEANLADAEEIRCAAAVLVNQEQGEKTLPILTACRESAGTGDGNRDGNDKTRRNVLDVAISANHQAAGRFAEMEAVTRRLVAAAPASERAEALHVAALASLGRWDEIRALAESRLQRSPGDAMALRLLAQDALRAGNFERAEKHLLDLTGGGKARAQDFNQLAWMLLELGRVDEQTVGYSQRAATLSSYGNPADLHTLAAIYADLGKTAEAYQVILQSLAAKDDEAPESHDWYVFGRLAEHYGLPDVARGYYKKVAPPKRPEEEPMSTHALAARRLAALGEGKKGQQKAKL